MFTRILTPTAAALLLGVFSQSAAATEEMYEIIVYGSDVVARMEARDALFRSEMNEYIQSVTERIRATLQEGVKIEMVPKLELASSEEPVRG